MDPCWLVLQALTTLGAILIAMKATKNLVSVPLVLKNDTRNEEVLKVGTFLGLPVRTTSLPVRTTSLPVRTTSLPVRTTSLPVRTTSLLAQPPHTSGENNLTVSVRTSRHFRVLNTIACEECQIESWAGQIHAKSPLSPNGFIVCVCVCVCVRVCVCVCVCVSMCV